MKYLQLAFSFLTILPVGPQQKSEPGDTGRAAVWFPWVGVVVGFITFVGWGFFDLVLPVIPATVLTLALWVILTGGLHLDGLADCCDGLLSAASKDRRLKIMADPHIGAFGMIGLVLFLLLKVSVLSYIPSTRIFHVLLLAPTFSRWLVLLAALQPLAQPEGMAADFSLGLSNTSIAAAAVIPIALIFWGGWNSLLAVVLASLAIASIVAFARSRIGGMTGDVFGLIIEVSELVILMTYAAL